VRLAGTVRVRGSRWNSQIVRAQLAIPAELSILCGLAVGCPPLTSANRPHISRESIEKNIVFLDR
jgi:hypothetical protein